MLLPLRGDGGVHTNPGCRFALPRAMSLLPLRGETPATAMKPCLTLVGIYQPNVIFPHTKRRVFLTHASFV